MSVGEGGSMLDAGGNPVFGGTGAGGHMQLTDLIPMDSGGNVLDEYGGKAIEGADGSPLSGDSVKGFDSTGAMLDGNGQPLTDANGDPLRSQAAAGASARLMGDRALAQAAATTGLSDYTSSARGFSGAPIGQFAGESASTASPAPSGPVAPGSTPISDAARGGHGPGIGQFAGVAGAQVLLRRMGQGRQQHGSDWFKPGQKGPNKSPGNQ